MIDTVKRAEFNELVRNCRFAADDAVIGKPFATDAQATATAVEAALKFAVCNGLVKMVDVNYWPSQWLPMNPEAYPIKIED